jgi:Skp family chaperone for outer membrane proteins
VRKLILTATCCTCLAGAAWFLNPVVGQDKTSRKEAAAEDIPHKIALIDIYYVFNNYEKRKYLLEELKAEAQEVQTALKEKFKKGQALAAELKDYKEGTPEYDAKVQKIQKLETDLKFEDKQQQARLQREIAKRNLSVYHEVHDAVEKFCKHYNYTLVIQFSRGEINSTDPQRMMQAINQPVVYYRKTDTGKCKDDLSEPVVKWLNDKYAKDSGNEAATPTAKSSQRDKNVRPAEGVQPSTGSKRVKTAD